ncbi:hypothetical protein CO615_10785 [Lysobacteraceae bacterium NML75-0749]|nr:hypothetical protein CO615_10785 [Xanthomonadaceae bacterium NML75-0749]
MHATCPHCAFQAEIEAFFSDDDGKRLAAVVADLPPECARALLRYLRLFKPARQGLRMARAVKIAQEVRILIERGTVARDERTGVHRPVSPAMWAEGMETMLDQRGKLTLPLDGHGYLRAVVFGLADKADAQAERQREEHARSGQHLQAASEKAASQPAESRLENQLAWIAQMQSVGAMSAEQAEEERQKAREKYA